MFSSNLRDISLRLNLRAGGQISISEISNTLSFCQNTAPLKNTYLEKRAYYQRTEMQMPYFKLAF